jgi:hypothetical protein
MHVPANWPPADSVIVNVAPGSLPLPSSIRYSTWQEQLVPLAAVTAVKFGTDQVRPEPVSLTKITITSPFMAPLGRVTVAVRAVMLAPVLKPVADATAALIS